MENLRDKKGRFKSRKQFAKLEHASILRHSTLRKDEKLHLDFDAGLDVETENKDDTIFLGFQRPDTTDHKLKRFLEVFLLRMFLSHNSVKYTINQTLFESKKSCPAFLFC